MSGPILHRYRCHIGVYPFLATTDIGIFADIGSDMYPILQTISQYTEIGANFQRHRFRCVINITIYRYRGFTILGRITRYRGRRRRCRTGTGSSPPPVAALAAAGPLPRHSNRPSLLILGTHRLYVDQGGYLVFTGPRRSQATVIAENSVKLEKIETFNDINVPPP